MREEEAPVASAGRRPLGRHRHPGRGGAGRWSAPKASVAEQLREGSCHGACVGKVTASEHESGEAAIVEHESGEATAAENDSGAGSPPAWGPPASKRRGRPQLLGLDLSALSSTSSYL